MSHYLLTILGNITLTALALLCTNEYNGLIYGEGGGLKTSLINQEIEATALMAKSTLIIERTTKTINIV